MPILDLQKRARELGRIRLGYQETFTKRDGSQGTRPAKLDRFRFTTNSEALINKLAELYGGEPREWEGGTQKWELVSNATRLPIMVPPQPVSQWYEFWTAGGCKHRCDGERNVLTDEPCDLEEQVQVGRKKVNPHTEAIKKPTTRLNVVLRDVEGIGVWRTESHGFNAAIELPDVAEFLAQAGGYVNGWLALEQRSSIDTSGDTPQTHHFLVPIIEVDVTPAQLMAGAGRVAAPALAGGPVGETPALNAAGPDYVALAAEITDPQGITDLWNQARDAGHMTQGLNDYLHKRHTELSGPVPGAEEDEPVDAEFVDEPGAAAAPAGDDDADLIWQQILKQAGELGWGLTQVASDFKESMGVIPDEASATELQAYLTQMQTGEQVAS